MKRILKKLLIYLAAVIAVLILFVLVVLLYNIRDRHRGYSLDLHLPEQPEAAPLRVGLSRISITPDLPDRWIDADHNARYQPDRGDSFIDGDGDNQFDAIWLAGFHQNRPAAGVHDPIWARSVVWDNGQLCVALVSLDAIGLFHDDVIDIRNQLTQQLPAIDYVIIAATHNHEVPDLMGLWGPNPLQSGVNDDYLKWVRDRTVESVVEAYGKRRPARVELARLDSTASDLVRDSRPPRVLDDELHLMLFRDIEADTVLGLMVNWGNHPETLESRNLQITSDFCHYLRQGIESGLRYPDRIVRRGIGGTAVFVNGAVGGLMTTIGAEIYDPWLDRTFKAPDFDKARAQGHRLADLILDRVEDGPWYELTEAEMELRVRTILLPVRNKYFLLGGALGIFHRGFVKLRQVRSEVGLLRIGPAYLLTIPGEINPEIVNGGVETPDGADYPGEPVEVPPLRDLLPGPHDFLIGLGNDEIGYIMPETHWDTEPPFTYGAKKPFYGEVNSLGPQTGPIIHRTAADLIRSMLEK